MMEDDTNLKLQAYLDGELSPGEARQIEARLATDAGAQALAAELKWTKSALAGSESNLKLPESREFYWSKIEREIRRQSDPALQRPKESWIGAWRRFLYPAGAVAVLTLAALLAIPRTTPGTHLEAALSDPGAFTYRDYGSRTTLVWLSYPAQNEFAEADADDTLF